MKTRFRHLGAGDLLAPLLWLFPVPGVGKHRQERGKVGRLVGKPGVAGGWWTVGDPQTAQNGGHLVSSTTC